MDLLWEGFVQAIRLILRMDPELRELVGRSLAVSLAAAAVASAIGVPVGVALAIGRFPGRTLLQLLVSTGMGLPPVLVGLAVTLVLWRTGPFGALAHLYTPVAMVLAQVLVATPIVAGVTRAALGLLDPDLLAALRVDGAGR